MTEGQWSRVSSAGFSLANRVTFSAGIALLVGSLYFDGTSFLRLAGFPADRLYHPRVQGDLALIRMMGGLIAVVLVLSQAILWMDPNAGRRFYGRVEALTASAGPLFVPMALAILILMKIGLQLTLFAFGYTLYEADDLARALKADYLAHSRTLAPGADLGYWAMVAGSHQLPFADYLFGFGLAVYRNIYLTPKIVNSIVSSGAVIAVYLLGRELFGRTAGLVTAALFAFLPWTVWLGMSGMPSDLPSVLFMTLFGLFLFRWLQSRKTVDLLTAAGLVSIANGFRYENWMYSGVFSVLIVVSTALQWRAGRRQGTVAAICALTLINVFPVAYMAFSYLTFGDWLPEYKNAAFMISPGSVPVRISNISMPVLAFGSFPFELLASIAGIAVFLRSDRRGAHRTYLLLVAVTFLLFGTMVRWQLPSYGGIARYLLSFMTLVLPFAGFLLARFLKAPATGWNARAIFITGFVLVLGAFDVVRAFNYPGQDFPKDALYAGRTLRSLQDTGTIPSDAKILIERAEDWGDEGVVVLANRPEKFVVLNELSYLQAGLLGNLNNRPAAMAFSGHEGVRGDVCYQRFQSESCKKSIREEGFDVVILSSPERVSSFQEAFPARSWRIGRYYIFDLSR